MNDLLDEATAALRDETASSSDDGHATLARVERTLAGEAIVDEAVRVFREHEVETDDPALTLARIERSLEVRNVRDRYGWALAAAALIALVVGAPTAWAAGLFDAWSAEREHAEPAPREPANEPAPVEPVIVHEPVHAEPALVPEPAIERVRRIAPPRTVVRVTPEEEEDVREERLFATAHRAHFAGSDREGALEAWDQYLAAYPTGRYAPEARYNRALTLIRLARHGEARAALAPFASRPGYRSREAARLIEAIDARTEQSEQ